MFVHASSVAGVGDNRIAWEKALPIYVRLSKCTVSRTCEIFIGASTPASNHYIFTTMATFKKEGTHQTNTTN